MWLIFSISAAAIFALLTLLWKKLFLMGVPVIIQLFVTSVMIAACYAGHMIYTKNSMQAGGAAFLVMIAAAVLAYMGNVLQMEAFSRAPNPGYVVAIVSTHAILVTLASAFLFGSHIGMIKIAGVLLCVLGAILLSL